MYDAGHDLHVLAYTILFIYTIFAQIGYAYFPEFSVILGAYFGPEIFYNYWFFMFGSFVSSFVLYLFIRKRLTKKIYFIARQSNIRLNNKFFIIFIIFGLSLSWYFISNRFLFKWGGGDSMGGIYFAFLFRLFIGLNLIVYILFRFECNNNLFFKRLSFFLFLIGTIFILLVASASGSRSDILYFLIAIITLELSPFRESLKNRKRKIIFILLITYFTISYLQGVLELRTTGFRENLNIITVLTQDVSSGLTYNLINQLIVQDYFAPSHTLFVSIRYNIIDLFEVVKSNFFNSLFGFNYQTIGASVLEKTSLGFHERGAGWSYHLFVEGFNAMGYFGILYNAIIWNLGMFFLSIYTKTNNEKLNRYILAILALLIMNTMRSQSAMFVRYYWASFLPILFLLLFVLNYKIKYKPINK